jgi:hypothetical protein
MRRKMIKKKSVAFKATTSKGKSKIESSSDEDSSSCDSDDIDEKIALFVKQFGKFMKKKGYHARRRKNLSKKNEHTMRCFRCHSMDHLIAKCPYDSDDEDDNKSKKKGHASIAIQEKVSLFDTLSCSWLRPLMYHRR